jgi:hypothetical protein
VCVNFFWELLNPTKICFIELTILSIQFKTKKPILTRSTIIESYGIKVYVLGSICVKLTTISHFQSRRLGMKTDTTYIKCKNVYIISFHKYLHLTRIVCFDLSFSLIKEEVSIGGINRRNSLRITTNSLKVQLSTEIVKNVSYTGNK